MDIAPGIAPDRIAGLRTRLVRRDVAIACQLIVQLQAENDFLKDELRRKDRLLLAFAQGASRPEALPPGSEDAELPALAAAPRRLWWQRLIELFSVA